MGNRQLTFSIEKNYRLCSAFGKNNLYSLWEALCVVWKTNIIILILRSTENMYAEF